MSFRQVAQVMLDTKELLGIGSIGSFSEVIVSCNARLISLMNLQSIVELLRKCWAFSVALDMVTHMATAYCNVRIRICHQTTLQEFHLLSIPSMNAIQVILYSACLPRQWTISNLTGVR